MNSYWRIDGGGKLYWTGELSGMVWHLMIMMHSNTTHFRVFLNSSPWSHTRDDVRSSLMQCSVGTSSVQFWVTSNVVERKVPVDEGPDLCEGEGLQPELLELYLQHAHALGVQHALSLDQWRAHRRAWSWCITAEELSFVMCKSSCDHHHSDLMSMAEHVCRIGVQKLVFCIPNIQCVCLFVCLVSPPSRRCDEFNQAMVLFDTGHLRCILPRFLK